MKKLMLALTITTLMMSQQSCKKEDTTVTPTPTEAFSLVGTWTLSSTIVSFGTNYSPTPAEIAKSVFYNASDFVFTSDGKYTRGKDSGTWTYVGGTLKLGNLSYSSSYSDLNTFTFGNSWIGFNTNANPNTSELDAISTAQGLMNVYSITIPTSSKDVSYKVTYKKK